MPIGLTVEKSLGLLFVTQDDAVVERTNRGTGRDGMAVMYEVPSEKLEGRIIAAGSLALNR